MAKLYLMPTGKIAAQGGEPVMIERADFRQCCGPCVDLWTELKVTFANLSGDFATYNGEHILALDRDYWFSENWVPLCDAFLDEWNSYDGETRYNLSLGSNSYIEMLVSLRPDAVFGIAQMTLQVEESSCSVVWTATPDAGDPTTLTWSHYGCTASQCSDTNSCVTAGTVVVEGVTSTRCCHCDYEVDI